VCVAVYGYGANTLAGTTDVYKTSSGAQCEKAYNDNTQVEFGFEGDPNKDDVRVMAKLVIGFGGVTSDLDCMTIKNLEEEKMAIENERLRLELELLRRQLEGGQNETTVTSPAADGDDW